MTPFNFHRMYLTQSLDGFPTLPEQISIPIDYKEQSEMTNFVDGSGDFNYMPISLRFWYMRNLSETVLDIERDDYHIPNNNIFYADFSNTKLSGYKIPTMIGLNQLQGVNIFNCDINSMDEDQLKLFPRLKYFNARYNNLYHMNLKMLLHHDKLEWLDLGYNKLKNIPPQLISNLPALRYMSLHGNPLVTGSLDVENNQNLKQLDLSECSLVNMTDIFLDQLEMLSIKSEQNLILNISNNRFECSCETLKMIHWFQHTM